MGQGVAVACQQSQQCGDIGAVPFAIQIAFGQPNVTTGQHAPEERFVMHLQAGAALAIAKPVVAAVGQSNLQLAALQLFQQGKDRGNVA